MQYTTPVSRLTIVHRRLHGLVILTCLILALMGRMPDSTPGWVTCPPSVYALSTTPRRRARRWNPANWRDQPWSSASFAQTEAKSLIEMKS